MENFQEDDKLLDELRAFQQKYIFKPFEFNQGLELQISSRWNQRRLIFDDENEFKDSENQMLSSELIFSDAGSRKDFYTIVMMLFPQNVNTGSGPLQIDVADTLFYLQDNCIVYVFKDAKKGLTKIKNRNINVCELFLKRRALGETYTFGSMLSTSNFGGHIKKKNEKSQMPKKQKYSQSKCMTNNFFVTSTSEHIPTVSMMTMNTIVTEEKTSRAINQLKDVNALNLNYVALLKYKDNSFIRLKQSDFRAIFTNPLYANERFKNNNNTQYIQALPNDYLISDRQSFQQQLEFRIQFNFNRFQKEYLFKLACNTYVLENNDYIPQGKRRRDTIKKLIKETSIEVYLHYIAFEIYCYISMHYNKKIEFGQFIFLKTEKDSYLLAGVENLNFRDHKEVEYIKKQLFSNQKPIFQYEELRETTPRSKKANLFQQKVEIRSEFQKEIITFFDRTNQKIKNDVTDFVCSKMEMIKNTKDKTVSKLIFKVLHPYQKQDFHQILKNGKQLQTLLKPKEKPLEKKMRLSCASKQTLPDAKQTMKYQMLQSNQSHFYRSRVKTAKPNYKKYKQKSYIFTGI